MGRVVNIWAAVDMALNLFLLSDSNDDHSILIYFIHIYVHLLIFSVIPYCLNMHANIHEVCNIRSYVGSTKEWSR